MRRSPFALPCLLVVAVLAMPAIPVAAAPGSTPAATTSASISASEYAPDSQECAMLAKINAYRKSKGRGALTLSRTLGAAAEHHSREMASKNYFSHQMRNGVSWSQNISNHGYPGNTYRGENIAAGYSRASDTFTQWRNSSAHNANMLSSNYKAIGIGRAGNSNATYRWYWTTTFGSANSRTIAC